MSGLVSTKSKKPLSWLTTWDSGSCDHASPQKKRNTCTEASSGPPRYVSFGVPTGAAASVRNGTIWLGFAAIGPLLLSSFARLPRQAGARHESGSRRQQTYGDDGQEGERRAQREQGT